MCECCNSCDSSKNYALLLVPQILSVVNIVLGFFGGPNNFLYLLVILLVLLHMIQCCFVNKIMVLFLAILSLAAGVGCFAEAAFGNLYYFVFASAVNFVTGTLWLAISFCEFSFVCKNSNGKGDEDEVVAVATLVKAEGEAAVATPVVATIVEPEENV